MFVAGFNAEGEAVIEGMEPGDLSTEAFTEVIALGNHRPTIEATLRRAVAEREEKTAIRLATVGYMEINKEAQPTSGDKPDMVNQPPHYANRKFETIDVIRDALTPEEFRGFLKGNALKYTLREGRKPGAEQDLSKAQWYLDRLEEFDFERT